MTDHTFGPPARRHPTREVSSLLPPVQTTFWGGVLLSPTGAPAQVLVADPTLAPAQVGRVLRAATRPPVMIGEVGGMTFSHPLPVWTVFAASAGLVGSLLTLDVTGLGHLLGTQGGMMVALASTVATSLFADSRTGRRRTAGQVARLDPHTHRGLLSDAWALDDLVGQLRTDRDPVISLARRLLWDAATQPRLAGDRLRRLRLLVTDLVTTEQRHEQVLAGWDTPGTGLTSTLEPAPADAGESVFAAPAEDEDALLVSTAGFEATMDDLRLSLRARREVIADQTRQIPPLSHQSAADSVQPTP